MLRVSVVMAVHNGEAYVAEAVSSVLSQEHEHLDLILVNDGSTDGTESVLTSFDDRRIILVSQEQSGVAPARNRGLREARGELVAFIDHDDVWFPDKLRRQVEVFADPEVGLVGSLMNYLGDRGPTRATAGERADDQLDRIAAAKLMPFPLSSIVARRVLIEQVGGFDEGLARIGQVEDLDLVSRIARLARIVTVQQVLGYYRVHGQAASFKTFHAMRRGTRFLRDRILAEESGHTLTWDEWCVSATDRRSAIRGDRANYLYRSAGFDLVSGHWLRGFARLVHAGVLNPAYVLSRLRRQLNA